MNKSSKEDVTMSKSVKRRRAIQEPEIIVEGFKITKFNEKSIWIERTGEYEGEGMQVNVDKFYEKNF